MFVRLRQHRSGAWRDIRVCVDLSVWMGECHPDFFAAVLEAEHLFHKRIRRQLFGPRNPGTHNRAHAFEWKLGDGRRVIAREAHHFAVTGRWAIARTVSGTVNGFLGRRGKARKPILEHRDVVVSVGVSLWACAFRRSGTMDIRRRRGDVSVSCDAKPW